MGEIPEIETRSRYLTHGGRGLRSVPERLEKLNSDDAFPWLRGRMRDQRSVWSRTRSKIRGKLNGASGNVLQPQEKKLTLQLMAVPPCRSQPQETIECDGEKVCGEKRVNSLLWVLAGDRSR